MNFIKDLYTYIWEILYKFNMPFRAILIFTSVYLFFTLFFKIWGKWLKSLLFLLSFLLIDIFIRINYFLILRYRNLKKKVPGYFIRFDDICYTFIESLHNLIVKSKPLSRSAKVLIFIILNICIILSFTNALEDTRMEKYSFAFNDFYYSIENKISPEIEFTPTPLPSIPIEEESTIFILNDRGLKGANIREKPSLDSKTIAVVSGDIKLEFMNESSVDSNNIIWNLVKLENGAIGWISNSLVVQESIN